jgi:hypothetical protein
MKGHLVFLGSAVHLLFGLLFGSRRASSFLSLLCRIPFDQHIAFDQLTPHRRSFRWFPVFLSCRQHCSLQGPSHQCGREECDGEGDWALSPLPNTKHQRDALISTLVHKEWEFHFFPSSPMFAVSEYFLCISHWN